MKCHVYLMRCEGFLKIGVALDVGQRQRGIQTGNPFDVTVVAYRPFPTIALATAAEAALHRQFVDKQHRSEWFVISDDEAIEALRAVSAEETVTIEWLPFKGAPGFKEEVPKAAVN